MELYPYDHAPSRVRKNYGNNPCFEQKSGALHWKTIQSMGEQAFIPYLLSRIETEAVYITIDKDVLAREDAITNWDQGSMRLPYLIDLLKAITAKHRVIGADVTGDYSAPRYTGSLWTKAMKRGEILLDQPHCRPCPKESLHINMTANHSLLEVLSAAMA
jgi:hypothetical protein